MISKMEKRILAMVIAVAVSVTTIMSGNFTAYAAEVLPQSETEAVTVGTENETVLDGTTELPMYQFIPEVSGTYRFYSIASGDTYGYLYDEKQNLLCSDNDGGEEFDFSMKAALEAGKTYYLSVGYFMEEETGTITWMVEPCKEEMEQAEVKETEKETKAAQAEEKKEVTQTVEEPSQQAVLGDYSYNMLADGTVEITGYTGTATNVSIPSSIGGKSVSSVGEIVFAGNQTLQTVTIPNTVTKLQYAAFYGCSNLKSVKFAANSKLQTIGRDCFSYCSWSGDSNKITRIELPDSVKTLEKGAFCGSRNLNTIVFGKNMKTIGKYALASTAFTSINLQDSITEVKYGAFSYCKSLSKVTIGKGLKEIDGYVFGYCTNLKNISIPSNIISIGSQAFYGSGLTAITIPDSVTSIGSYAFGYCENLATAKIGNGLAYISYGAFEGCNLKNITIGSKVKTIEDFAFAGNEMKTISIPKNVTELEYAVFLYCTNLATITIPDTLTKIGGRTFENTAWYNNQPNGVVYAGKVLYNYKGDMPAGTVINVKKGTKGIAGFAFLNQSNLKSVNIPEGVTNIGEIAFYNCPSITSIKIPNSVTEIEDYALGLYEVGYPNGTRAYNASRYYIYYQKVPNFTIYGDVDSAAQKYAEKYGFNFIKSIHTVKFMDGNKVVSTQNITSGQNAIAPVLTKKNYTLTWDKSYNNVKSELIVNAKWVKNPPVKGEIVKSADAEYKFKTDKTFEYVKNLNRSVKKVTIPSTITVAGKKYKVTSVYSKALAGNTKMTELVIGNSVTKISDNMFKDCTALKKVTIGSNVKSIGKYAFSGCRNLTSVKIPYRVASIGQKAFYGCSRLSKVAFDYRTRAKVAKDAFSKIAKGADFYVTNDNAEYMYKSDKTLEYRKNLDTSAKKVTIPSTITVSGKKYKVTSVYSKALAGNKKMTELVMGKYITKISDKSFKDCIALKKVTIGSGVKSIGKYAFSGCKNLTSVKIPSKVTSIGERAFYKCPKIAKITFSSTKAPKIGKYAFSKIAAKATFYVPKKTSSQELKIFKSRLNSKTGVTGKIK